MTDRWTMDRLMRLAARGVAKVDLLGPRGTTLCTMDEIEAMAAVLVLSKALPPDLLTPAKASEGDAP